MRRDIDDQLYRLLAAFFSENDHELRERIIHTVLRQSFMHRLNRRVLVPDRGDETPRCACGLTLPHQ